MTDIIPLKKWPGGIGEMEAGDRVPKSLLQPHDASEIAGLDDEVRAVTLDGLNTGSTADVTAADSVLSALGKLQAARAGKVDSNDPRLSDAREWTAETVSQAEAEAGIATTRRAWTAQRVRQAIAGWWLTASTAFGRSLATAADAAAGRTALGVREQLKADRTYFVRTDGSDSNNGLSDTTGGAFLTVQRAVDAAASIDSSIYQTTIKIADGAYTHPVVVGALVGAKPLIILGNDSSPGSVTFNIAGAHVTVNDQIARIVVRGITFTGGGIHLNATPAGSIEYANVIFNSAGARHINCQLNGYVGCIGSYTIAGGAPSHATALQGGKIRLGISVVSTTITLTGTPNFSQGFIRCGEGPSLLACAVTPGQPVFVGAATGPRYAVSTNAVINTNGAGASYLPGNAAGTAATGGQYV